MIYKESDFETMPERQFCRMNTGDAVSSKEEKTELRRALILELAETYTLRSSILAFEYDGGWFLCDDAYRSSSLCVIERTHGERRGSKLTIVQGIARDGEMQWKKELANVLSGKVNLRDSQASFGKGSGCNEDYCACGWHREHIASVDEGG